MKEKAIAFIIGLLTGAIISTGAIFIYTLAENNAQGNTVQAGGQMGGQMDQNGQMGPNGQTNNENTPPDLPNNTNGQSDQQTSNS